MSYSVKELKEEIVRLDDLSHGDRRETLAMAPDGFGTVDAREHRRLSGRRLRNALDAKTGVNRLRMPLEQTIECRADLLVDGIVRRGRGKSDTVDE